MITSFFCLRLFVVIYKLVFSVFMKTVILHQCTEFGCKRTQIREVIGINNNYRFLLPEAVCCCLQTYNFYFDETLS